jgi:flavodoxin
MKWKKVLVVYYSRTGFTKTLAEDLAKKLNADLEEVKTQKSYEGFFGYQRALIHALFNHQPKIDRIKVKLEDYDLVMIGGPIWWNSMPGPIRTFLIKNKNKFSNIAFFSSQGGTFRRERMFTQMENVVRRGPRATLSISDNDIDSGEYKKMVNVFINKLQDDRVKIEKKILNKRPLTVVHAHN